MCVQSAICVTGETGGGAAVCRVMCMAATCLLHGCCMGEEHSRYEEAGVLRSKDIKDNGVALCASCRDNASCRVSWGHTACVCLCGGEEGWEGGGGYNRSRVLHHVQHPTSMYTCKYMRSHRCEGGDGSARTDSATARHCNSNNTPTDTYHTATARHYRSYSSYSTAATARQLTHTSSPLHC